MASKWCRSKNESSGYKGKNGCYNGHRGVVALPLAASLLFVQSNTQSGYIEGYLQK